jgi:hypothetical protein
MTKKLALADMVQPIGQCRLAADRLDLELSRWRDQLCDVEARHRLPGIAWAAIQDAERRSVAAAWKALQAAVSRLADAVGRMEEHRLKDVVRASVDLMRLALEEAEKDGFLPWGYGRKYSLWVRRACGWLSFADEVSTWESLSNNEQCILQAAGEEPGLKRGALATAALAASESPGFGDTVASLVKSGLLSSGRGRGSTGYRLTHRGERLVELSRQ